MLQKEPQKGGVHEIEYICVWKFVLTHVCVSVGAAPQVSENVSAGPWNIIDVYIYLYTYMRVTVGAAPPVPENLELWEFEFLR